jgi:vacuole morphology and inheritance protein 14
MSASVLALANSEDVSVIVDSNLKLQGQTQQVATDLMFAQNLIETMTITIAANPLYEDFRAKLRGKAPTQIVPSKEVLFVTLYKTWCISPVATLTLCLISRNYELAYNLIPRFTMVDIDTTRLIQLGNLVQLIESPSFTSKR